MSKKRFIRSLKKVGKELVRASRSELRLQGHYAHGRLDESLKAVVQSDGGTTTMFITMLKYGYKVDKGGFKIAGRSVMTDWALTKGYSHKAASLLAKRIAHRKAYLPGAIKYSYNGRITGWMKYGLENAWKNNEKDIAFDSLVDEAIDEFIKTR